MVKRKQVGRGRKIRPVAIAAAGETLYALEANGTIWRCLPEEDFVGRELDGWDRVCPFVDGYQDEEDDDEDAE